VLGCNLLSGTYIYFYPIIVVIIIIIIVVVEVLVMVVVVVEVQNLLSETLGTRHVSEMGIFRISEW
jgi:hypothetical protein